jgi:hydroxymethylglutaryl-CoA reductase
MAESRVPGFHRLTVSERREILCLHASLSEQDLAIWDDGGLDTAIADQVVENAVGVYALPLGVAVNFRVNERDYFVPMAVEEPSVIAAASNAARMVRVGGGFVADADPPIMTAQIEIVGVGDPDAARARIEAATDELLQLAHATLPRLCARGGGAREVEVRALPGRVVVHVHVDCRDAMGANMVNTVAEALAQRVTSIAGGGAGARAAAGARHRHQRGDRRARRDHRRVPVRGG